MNLDYVNDFVDASKSVFKDMLGIEPATGDVFIKQTGKERRNFMILMGLTGRLRGNVLFAFDTPFALGLASTMIGMQVSDLDEMGKSALCELCNMILGKSATLLSNRKILIDITPPSVLTGDNIEYCTNKSDIACVPFSVDGKGKMELDISYVES